MLLHMLPIRACTLEQPSETSTLRTKQHLVELDGERAVGEEVNEPPGRRLATKLQIAAEVGSVVHTAMSTASA